MKMYILVGKELREETNLARWSMFMSDRDNCSVKYEELPTGEIVSTIFLGFDHNSSGRGAPRFFETVVLKWRGEELQWSYATYDEALIGHMTAVSWVIISKLKRKPPISLN